MANKDIWTPQLEAKLHAWHQIQLIADKKKPAPCVTISREFGCQAYPLAEALAKRFNSRVAGEPWVVIDKGIIDEVARMAGFSVDQIEKSQDTPASLKAILAMFLDSSRAEETKIFAHMNKVISDFAKRGNCILVGRGAVFVARDLPNCVHLRLVAPYEFRVEKIMRAHKLSQADAEKYIDLHEKQRDDFIRRFANSKPGDPTLYHLVINNARLDIDEIAELADEYITRSCS